MTMAEGHDKKNLQLLQIKALQIASFLEEHLPLANCHTVHFITQNYWDKFIKSEIQNELLQLNLEELAQLPSGHIFNSDENQISEKFYELDLSSLRQLAEELYPKNLLKQHVWISRQHTLSLMDVITTNLVLNKELSFKNLMSPKKSHEVEIMAEIINNFASQYEISQVVDIGSGKGYLSSILAICYKLFVLGIDSNNMNTHSASVYNSRIFKQWQHFDNLQSHSSEVQSKNNKSLQHRSKQIINQGKDDTDHNHKTQSSTSTQDEIKGKYLPITQYVNDSTDLHALLQSNGFSSEQFIITGLHTCGNLSSSIIKLFLSNNKAKVLCNVGCCYNHIEEEFYRNPFWKEGDAIPTEFGFPLSSILRSQKLILGRNARMLASLPPERMAAEKKNSSLSLFYRALLQVIFLEKLDDDSNQYKVGKIASKCKNFVEYVQKAVKKLNLTLEISSEEIEKYFHDYIDYKGKINAFFHYRAILAPCIESLILLDRLCYLLEQDNVDSAYLVPMFNPTASPRCYGLIAFKK